MVCWWPVVAVTHCVQLTKLPYIEPG